jgi:hypothetical protein
MMTGRYQVLKKICKFLGEVPAIDIIYKKDVMINEVTGKGKRIEKVQIIFLDLDDKFKK